MQVEWYKHLKTPEDIESFQKRLINCKDLLDRLKNICYNRAQIINSTSIKDFDTPNWALKRAYEDGQVQGLNYVIQLLSLDQRED